MKKNMLFFFIILPFAIFCNNVTICNENPIIDQILYQLRDPTTDKEAFRTHLKKLGEYMGLEVAKHLHTSPRSVVTLLDKEAVHNFIDEEIVLVTIFRAGLPFYQGMQEVFPHASSGFFAMKRLENPNPTHEAPTALPIQLDYYSLPVIQDKTIIIVDTMLATASSLLEALTILEKYSPKKIIVVGAIAAEEGIKRVLKHNPDIQVFAGVVDPVLDHRGFIVPGLGDAGDRTYGMPVIKIHKE